MKCRISYTFFGKSIFLFCTKSQISIFNQHRSWHLVRHLGLAGTREDASWRGSMSHTNFRIPYDVRAELWQFPFWNLVFWENLAFQLFCSWQRIDFQKRRFPKSLPFVLSQAEPLWAKWPYWPCDHFMVLMNKWVWHCIYQSNLCLFKQNQIS